MSIATTERANGNSLALAHAPKPSVSDGALANLTDSDRFQQLQRVATMMGTAAFTPQHLKGKSQQETIANCFRVVNQAMRWGFDPFAVGDETYVVSGKLGYQGKLVAAVINARAGLKGRLKADYSGKGEDRTVTVTGQFASETEPRTIELTLKNAKTNNSMWTKDPDQKLWYSGVVKWSRRHCPELILGVMTDDDLDRMKDSGEAVAVTDELDAALLEDRGAVEVVEEKADDKQPTSDDIEAAARLDEKAESLAEAIDDCMSALALQKVKAEVEEAGLGEERTGRLLAKIVEAGKQVKK